MKIRKALAAFGDDVALQEIDVTKHPEALRKYESRSWQEFADGYIHYLTVVAVNCTTLEDWYWDISKITEAVRRELEQDQAGK